MAMKSNVEQLKTRGYIEDNELKYYLDLSKEELLNYLHSRDAIKRTIAARILKKFKEICVLKELISSLIVEKKLYTKIALSESIEDDNSCLSDIITLMNKYKDDNLMIWKLIRALQSFRNIEALEILKKYIDSDIKQHQWEARRSMEQIQNRLMYRNN